MLEARYRADLKVYRAAIRQLDVCHPSEFKQVYENTERARLAFERAHFLLERHIAEHGCG